MRIARYTHQGQCHWGLTDEKQVFSLDARWPTLDQGLAQGTDALLRAAKDAAGTGIPVDQIQWLPPVEAHSKILCVGLNYGRHVQETGKSQADHPSLFLRHLDSFVGHEQAIVKPVHSGQFDYEGELVVVIGREGRHIAPEQAMDYVAGYTCMAENSVRDFQKHTTQVTAGKNFASSGSIGPWITPAGVDPATLQLTTRLNGQTVQDASVSDLIFPIPTLIAYISTFCVLRPGDLIATGTPEGIGSKRTPPLFMKEGDILEVSVSGMGVLRTPVINEQLSS
ncbi:fumarylacetoacetate hydrolase family protein [Pusillimonas sp. MFBS29]|uniref:fumarylacetoacetate hydrolase family protein n=1 Tax=Pusillimonas sp. MFBS29 TaxID=2886690 RepID=UPI001D12E33E|nr:fumarylacetoacetate hydrolase family protein [Pusillimonas sp. MFBS29]MCC2597209.1 fumarylacetoacetate hydrolase family protein [Pusillimonas sp. MFBS29]